ncbi:uncharacterized protein LOC116618323 [Nematostella vectensis]|uniref:uncharacterized protein LOC116618323 n=1 Tax=Nematostella vectensis TaxID=45351 RepID=UPI0020772DC9|nr:uncharacterized protein LOC116618323 [Nematostella vectensis]
MIMEPRIIWATLALVWIVSNSEAAIFKYQVRFYTKSIQKDSDSAAISIKLFGNKSDSLLGKVLNFKDNPDLDSLLLGFGKLGTDVYLIELAPTWLGELKSVAVTQTDTSRKMIWHLSKILIVDYEDHSYYDFFVDHLFNSSSTVDGRVDHEVALTRRYGGKDSPQYKGCLAKNSDIWFHEDGVYKKGKVLDTCSTNVTLRLDSGATRHVSRKEIIRSSPPLLVSDDALYFDTPISPSDNFIVSWNSSTQYYYAAGYYGTYSHITTYIPSTGDSFRVFFTKFKLKFIPSGQIVELYAAHMRFIDPKPPSFCMQDGESCLTNEPNFITSLYACHQQRHLPHSLVLATYESSDEIRCGILCSRHTQCMGFTLYGGQSCDDQSLTFCELRGSVDRDGGSQDTGEIRVCQRVE